MKITPISVEEYSLITDELDATETVVVGGWPCSAGRHPDLGDIVVLHLEDQAVLISRLPRRTRSPNPSGNTTASFVCTLNSPVNERRSTQ